MSLAEADCGIMTPHSRNATELSVDILAQNLVFVLTSHARLQVNGIVHTSCGTHSERLPASMHFSTRSASGHGAD